MESGAGGQHNEIGSEYRARLGALLATAVLLADDVSHLGAPTHGVPISLRAEADTVVDDLVLRLGDDRSIYVQAKHRAGLSTTPTTPFGKAIRQFVQAHRDARSEEPLVLAYARGSGPLEAFGAWCESLRYAERGVPSQDQLKASERFATLLNEFGVVDEDEIFSLAKRIHLWQVEPRHGDLYAVAMQRLGEVGVDPGDRGPAFDVLTKRVRLLARRRAGDDLAHLVAVLQNAGRLRLEGVRTTAVRAALLVGRYRERMQRQGRLLSAFGVPATVANVALSEGDAEVRVQLPRRADENVPRERTLGHALRRRGRVVVLGGGGSGKSTALRMLTAELGAAVEGPLPLMAHWLDLQQHQGDPLQALIGHAVRDLTATDAGLLGDALRQAFAQGECMLLLDGLDEVMAGRAKIAAVVKRWLDDVPASTEVVVAARPSAAEALTVFGWPHLRLAEPKRPAATARAVISAIAQEAGHDADWADERLAWVQDRWRRDSDLAATPLMVVLLATLAATVDELRNLPRTRTAVLIEALREVVTRWEVGTRHEGHVEVGGLPTSQANEALQRALYVFAGAALDRGEDDQNALEADLESFLGPMTKGRRRACVRDATEFWTATGLFTFTDGAVRAQPRSLAEAALAWQAIEEEVEPEALMRYRATSAGWDVLSLIALERVDVHRTWVSALAAHGSVDELIAVIDAHLDGAALAEDQMAQLVDSSAVVAMGDDRDLERVVEALLALELPPELHERLRQIIENRVRLADHPVAYAALLVRSPNLASHEIDRLRAFFSAPRPESRRDDEGTLHIDALDRLHRRTLQDVALRLLSHSRQDAEFVASRLEKLKTRTFPARLRRAFQRAGHEDLARAARATEEVEPVDWRHHFGEFEEATRTALRVAGSLDEPRPLSFIERRRLDELADLWASLRSEWWSPKWVLNGTGVLEDFMRLGVALGGFDSAAIAAQARQVLGELEHDPDTDDVVRDDAIQRRLTRWDAVEDCEYTVDSIVRIFGRVPDECLTPLMQALNSAPCKRHVHEAVVAQIPVLTRKRRTEATRLALVTASDPIAVATAWSTDDDVRRRHAAATAVRYMLNAAPDVGERVASALLEDQDRGVQARVVAELAAVADDGQTLSQAIEDKLESLKRAPRTPYLCQWCDAAVPAHMTSCPNCETSAPSFAEELGRALGRQRPVAPDLSRWLQELAPRRRVRVSHNAEWDA